MFQAIGRIFRWLGGDRDQRPHFVLQALGCMTDQTADQLRGFHREIVDLAANALVASRHGDASELAELAGTVIAAAGQLDRISCKIELLEVSRRARERRAVPHG